MILKNIPFIKRKVIFLIVFLYIIIYQNIPLYSQNDSLIKYLEIAAGNNPTVLQRFAEYEAALKKIPQVGALPDPQLDLGIFITPMELIGGNQVADLRLMQMFPWFGVLKNAKDEMSLMAKAKFELFRDAKLQVCFDVERTWNELFRIRKEIGISGKNLDILGVIEKLSVLKYKTPSTGSSDRVTPQAGSQMQTSAGAPSNTVSGMQGMGGNRTGQPVSSSGQSRASMPDGQMTSPSDMTGLTDLYRIQIEAGELKNNIALLKNQEKTLIARFNSYLNRPPASEVYTSETLLQDTLDLNLTTLFDSIQTSNPMLNMVGYEKEAYNARKKMVTGMGYPMVGFGLNYSVIGTSEMSTSTMNGKDMIMPMVSLSLPVYRKKYTAMREEALLLSQASSLNYQALSNSLNTELYSAYQLYNDAGQRVKLFADQLLLASKSLEILLKSYSASSVTLTDILRVRQQTLEYEIKQVEAIADLNTARAWLNRLMANPKNENTELQ